MKKQITSVILLMSFFLPLHLSAQSTVVQMMEGEICVTN